MALLPSLLLSVLPHGSVMARAKGLVIGVLTPGMNIWRAISDCKKTYWMYLTRLSTKVKEFDGKWLQ